MADGNFTTFHDLYELPRRRSPPPPGRMRSQSLQPSSGEPLFPPRRLRSQSLQAPGEAPLASTSLMLTAGSRHRSHPQSHSLQLADDYSRGRPRGVDAWTSRGRDRGSLLVEETEMTTLQPSGERRRGSHPQASTSNLTTPWQRAGERRRGSHPQYSRNDSQHAQYTASWMTQTSGRRGSQLSTGSGYGRDTELMYIETTPNSVSSQSSVNGSSMKERTDGGDAHLRDGGRQNGGENKPNNGTKKPQIKKDRHERESDATENTGRVQNTGHNTGLIHTNGVRHVCSRRRSQATQSVSGDGMVAEMMDKDTTHNAVSNQSSVSDSNMKQRANGDASISTNDRNLEDSHARSFGPTVNPQQVQNTPQATQGTVAEMTDTHATHNSVSNQSSIIGHNMKRNSDTSVHLRDGGRQNDEQNVGGNRPNNGINGRHRGLYGYSGPSEHVQHTNGLVRSTRLDHPGRVLVRRADVGTQSSTSWAADWKQRSSRCCSHRVLTMLFFVWFFGTLIFLVCIGAVAFSTLQHGGFTNKSIQTLTVARNTPRADLQQENIQPQELTRCASSPCLNGGTCVDGVNQYTCTCPAGYTGLYCQTDIAECASSPCLNGATCVDGVNQYTCTCPAGYTGRHCRTDISECASSPCLNRGTCVDGVNQYTCTCSARYTGLNCETDISECASSPCLNGGTCVDGVNQYTCTCSAGYTGHHCQRDIAECASSPCVNGATCVDGVNQYTCTCPAGYTGLHCQTKVAECASSPCENGATCVDGVNQYICTCPVGYRGLNCQTDIAECGSSPCINGATCVDGVNQYKCTCSAGYTGIHCETDIAECTSSPCLNGATCVDGVNQYTCTCPEGYAGPDCEIECTSSPCLGPWSQVSTFDDKVYSDCLYLRHGHKGPLSDCRDECNRQPGCNIINYALSTACVLKSCGSSDLMIRDWADGDEYAVHTRIVGD